MEIQRTDEETVEHIKQWWKENGLAIIIGLAIGFGGIFGVRGWFEHQKNQAEQASVIYDQLATSLASRKYEDVIKKGEALINEYSATPYASLAALSLAKAKVEQGNNTGAVIHLNWVIDNASDSGMQHIARVRLARLMFAAKDYAGVMKLLDGQKGSAFQSFYDEIRGDVHMAQGNAAMAGDAYRLAVVSSERGSQRAQLIQNKLDDVAVNTLVDATSDSVEK
ncbi:MAG: tetratricopeptide repeat protein [Gammaproteobacteria bacterium]|nr:tetratricopeptide repeat protein [Gammaproteobacteria bacterium]